MGANLSQKVNDRLNTGGNHLNNNNVPFPGMQGQAVNNHSNAEQNLENANEQTQDHPHEEEIFQEQAKERKKSMLKQVNLNKLNAYERIEAKLPLQVMDIREFEGRLKKLVYGKETISIRQLQYAFSRDYEDFDDLLDSESFLYKAVTSQVFRDETDPEDEINIQYLMLFGVLYCKGSNDVKSKVLYDILQDGLQEIISANDKDLKRCFGRLLEIPTAVLHSWASDFGDAETRSAQREPLYEKTEENKKKWQDALEEIKNAFLDEVFDINSKIKREEFIKAVAKKQNYLFKTSDIRSRVREALNNYS